MLIFMFAVEWACCQYFSFFICVCSCFLMLEAAVLTCFVPAGVLIFVDTLIAFRICCLLREPVHTTSPHRKPFDDPDTEEVHDNEIEMLSSGTNQRDYRSVQSSSPAPSAEQPVSELDPVYRPWVQLIAVIFLLLLFCLLWSSAAFVIVPPFEFAHDTIVYRCFYAVLAASLGLFFVIYYCICRSDVRSACLCRKRSSSSESSRWRYIKATNGSTSHESGKLHENGSAVCDVREMDESSVVMAAESLSQAAKSTHSDTDRGTSTKVNGPQFAAPDVAIQECVAFYNPRQNGVARKYWERSRKKRAMANLYHNEAQLHRFGDDSKPDGTSGNTTPNGNAKSAANGIHQKVVTAAVENVPQHVIELPDEQQPLLSMTNPRATSSDDHGRTLSYTSTDVATAHSNAVKCELMPSSDAATMAVSSVEQCFHSDGQNGGNLQTCAEGDKMLVSSELCAGKESAVQHPSSVDAVEQALSYDSKISELHSVTDVNCLHPADSQDNSEKEERRMHSPNTGTARAFINKNYCASISRPSHAVPKDSEVNETTSRDVSAVTHTSTAADIWVRQYSKPLKLKTETSV